MANKIDTHHPCYDTLHMKRDVFHAVKGGTDAIREKGETYLGKYAAESAPDYKARLSRSTIDGIVSRGCDTLSGAVFYGDIDTSKVNSAIISAKLLENIDNKGNHFNVFARQAFDAAFDGSAVILVDTPNVEQPVNSLEDEQVLGIRPYWRLYFADDVINWRYRVNPMSMEEELEFIVFHEPKEEVDPMNYFAVKVIDHYRVYYFDGMSVTWELWKKVKEGHNGVGAEFAMVANGVMANRSAIPVAIVGRLEDEPRLLVESRNEVKAYQKESSFDQVEYMQGAPTFCTKGYEGEETLQVGASVHLKLPIDGDAFYMQLDATGHAELKLTIAGIKNEIKAHLNELTTAAMAGGQEKTATQVNVEDRDKQARLIVWAEQFKDALELALGFTAEAMGMGIDEGGEIVLQTKWEVQKQEAEENKVRQAELEQANIAATAAKAAVSH